MLKKIYRLSSLNLRSPKNISGELFNLKIGKNNLQVSRFGFVISKKIDKRASVRNALKRKLSRSIEEIFDKIETGYDIVFYPKNLALGATGEIISLEINKIFSKEGLIGK